ncbi:MAG: AAA family ATPase [Rhodospirillales bacterium]|nr:AAA family ATPase [Rhodospirillales bacterium]
MLIVLGGLPGSGKSTIARSLARRLGAVHVRVDTIEQALRRSDVLRGEVGPAGYEIAYNVAEDNLRIGRIVIADSVNPLKITRDAWRAVGDSAAVEVAEVEVVCSDGTEHRRRVETRTADIAGLKLPTWQAVVDRDYEKWDREHIVVDTALKSVDEAVADLASRLGG